MALAEGRAVPQDLLGVLLTAADEAGQRMTDDELWEDVHDGTLLLRVTALMGLDRSGWWLWSAWHVSAARVCSNMPCAQGVV